MGTAYRGNRLSLLFYVPSHQDIPSQEAAARSPFRLRIRGDPTHHMACPFQAPGQTDSTKCATAARVKELTRATAKTGELKLTLATL